MVALCMALGKCRLQKTTTTPKYNRNPSELECVKVAKKHKLVKNPFEMPKFIRENKENLLSCEQFAKEDSWAKILYLVGLGDENSQKCGGFLEKHGFCRRPGWLWGDSFSLRFCGDDGDLNLLQKGCAGIVKKYVKKYAKYAKYV